MTGPKNALLSTIADNNDSILQVKVMAAGKKSVPRMRRNYEVAPGVMRFSAARMYRKRGVFAKKPFPVVKKKVEHKPKFVVKPVGGDKNGQERKVLVRKGVTVGFFLCSFLGYYGIGDVKACFASSSFKRAFQIKVRSSGFASDGTGTPRSETFPFLLQLSSDFRFSFSQVWICGSCLIKFRFWVKL